MRRALAAITLLLVAATLGATCAKSGSGHPVATSTRTARETAATRSSATATATNATPTAPSTRAPAAPARATSSPAGSTGLPNTIAPAVPTARTVRPGETGLYIALGDSLSAGYGASDASKDFVELVHAGLGPGMQLLNLGHGGDTSSDLINGGNLDRAVSEITQRDSDADPNNDVQLVTLEIGGNDLIALFTSLVLTGVCPDVATSTTKPECVDALRAVFDRYRPNLAAALDRLQAADASVPILLLTQYNPLEELAGLGDLGALSLEGMPNTPFPEGLNDIIRQAAQGRDDVTVVEMYAAFRGRTLGLISPDFIHPNDAGYQVMADAVDAAIDALRAR